MSETKSRNQQGKALRSQTFALPAIEDYSGLSATELRGALHELIEQIPEHDLAKFNSAFVTVVV